MVRFEGVLFSVGGAKERVRCSWLRLASMEFVSFEWFSMEVSMAMRSSVRDWVVRARRYGFCMGAARALRPRVRDQLAD
jgi:hypothetical protein